MAAIHELTDTWNNAGTVFDALDIDVTDTASNVESKLFRARVGGVDKFSVRKDSQLRYGPDASNYWTHTVSASGALTMQGNGAGGSITISPTAGQNVALNPTGSGGVTLGTEKQFFFGSTTIRGSTTLNIRMGGAATPIIIEGITGTNAFDNQLQWKGAGRIQAPSDGVFHFKNNANTGFSNVHVSAITGRETTAPTAVADAGILFFQDNGAGKTQLMVQFPTGTAQQIAIEA